MSKGVTYEEGYKEAEEALTSGRAFKKFCEFVEMQGGDLSSLEVSTKTIDIKSTKAGTLKNIKALALGELSVSLGAGRRTKEESIDHTVGIVIHKDLGDKVKVGDKLATLYVKDKNLKLNPDDYFEIE
jgi:pyrimidine-nucleoside phosphorylase